VVSSSSKKDIAVFTGDTLFVGFTGRTNLDDIEGYTPIGLSEILFDSVQKLKQL
jgi:glyoxylase-like metal-dependent hydrolase (beta-lactamase superfamily II)